MMAMAMDRLKKHWPMAARMSSGDILEKSGVKKYFTPSSAPGMVMVKMAMPMAMRMSRGMRMMLMRSMPPLTPMKMTAMTMPANRIIHR